MQDIGSRTTMLLKRVNLFCLPFAGGKASVFKTLPESLGIIARMVALELPGRGVRESETPPATVDAMIADVSARIDAEGESPYAIYGHGLGARLAYLTACRRRDEGRPAPILLVLASEGPPEVTPWRSDLSNLPEKEFLREVVAAGAYPEELLKLTPRMAETEGPFIRADIRAFDRFDPPNPEPLSCPILSILAGRDLVRKTEANRWSRRTSGHFETKTIPGAPFFFLKNMAALGKAIYDSLKAVVPSEAAESAETQPSG